MPILFLRNPYHEYTRAPILILQPPYPWSVDVFWASGLGQPSGLLGLGFQSSVPFRVEVLGFRVRGLGFRV